MKYRIGEQIDQCGFKKKYVAKQIGVTEKTLKNWDKGKGEPKFSQLLTIKKILKCKLEDLYEED